MARHSFSRRVRRRKRSGVPPGGARSIRDCNIERYSSGRRGGWEPKCGQALTFECNEVDEPLPTVAALRERYATLFGEP